MVSRPPFLKDVDLPLVLQALAQQQALHQERTPGRNHYLDREQALGRLRPLRRIPLEYQLQVYSKIPVAEMPRARKLPVAETYLLRTVKTKPRVI